MLLSRQAFAGFRRMPHLCREIFSCSNHFDDAASTKCDSQLQTSTSLVAAGTHLGEDGAAAPGWLHWLRRGPQAGGQPMHSSLGPLRSSCCQEGVSTSDGFNTSSTSGHGSSASVMGYDPCCSASAGDAMHVLFSVNEPHATSAIRSVFTNAVQNTSAAYDWMHATSGLPWWAVIPMTTLALRAALLPLSLRQAKIVRSNWGIYREARRLADQDVATAAAASPSLAPGAPGVPVVERTSAVLKHYSHLRCAAGVPHLAWLLVNPAVQLPVFLVANMTLRGMCFSSWHGLAQEGALWFPDLTQVAYVMSTGDMPMGVTGFVLPAIILAAGLTSLRIGVGAASASGRNAELEGTAVGSFLKVLPTLLYGLALVNTYWTVQLPHGVLLHWLASASFTLGLQGVLQLPSARKALLGLPGPDITPPAAAVAGQPRGVALPLPAELVRRVAEIKDADVLVVMGAQSSARHHYRAALYCLARALELQPHHVRAHYSAGQVHSLTFNWPAAEASFRVASMLAPEGSAEQGQAMYCLGTALHKQGRLEEAVVSYRKAAELWPAQAPVALFSLVHALMALGGPARAEEARRAVVAALEADSATVQRPFHAMLLQLQEQLQRQQDREPWS